jgi:conjugative relaxase-like TrwC/TraI family protein
VIDIGRGGISAPKAQTYFKRDFAAQASISYYSQKQQSIGQWHGELAKSLGLTGPVTEEQFLRLVDGRDPNARYDPKDLKDWTMEKGVHILSDKQDNELARVWQSGGYWRRSGSDLSYRSLESAQKEVRNEIVGQWIAHRNTISQQTGKAMEHRAGFDLVFNWDKSISVTAVHDPRIYDLEKQVVAKTNAIIERYVQCRHGINDLSQSTNNWIVATFQHTTARPVDGYSAPHLHTHSFIMNMTRDQNGKVRSIDPEMLFKAQRFAATVSESEMAYGLTQLGYKVEMIEKNHAPRISGYTQQYLDAESPRKQLINQIMAEKGYGQDRRKIDEIAHQYRDSKLNKPAEEIVADHLKVAAQYGNQHETVIKEARMRGPAPEIDISHKAERAVTYAKNVLSERLDVYPEKEVLQQALWTGQNDLRYEDVKKEFDRRSQTNIQHENGVVTEFIQARHAMAPNAAETSWTTHEAQQREREVIAWTRSGYGQANPILPASTTVEDIHKQFAHLNNGAGLNREQAHAVWEQATWNDRISGIRGGAGTGKTRALINPLVQLAEQKGYVVIGAAPTGKARHEMADAGIRNTLTLQKLVRVDEKYWEKRGVDTSKPRLYFLDEHSLASTEMAVKLLRNMQARPQDRIIEVGDPRQHESIQAGRIFEEQIQAGMKASSVDKIVRQIPDWYKDAVEKMQFGRPGGALNILREHGKVHEIDGPADRIQAIAKQYAINPTKTLVVSPDNASRKAINEEIRVELRRAGFLSENKIEKAPILIQRQDLTEAQLKFSKNYNYGDVILFHRSQKDTGIERNMYGRVVGRSTDYDNQWIDVEVKNGRKAQTIRYDPRSREGHQVEVYQRETRDFAQGDKLILRKAFKGLENGDTITVEKLDAKGNIEARADKNNQALKFNLRDNQHLDYGYASTSYLAQGATVDNVIVHVDAGDPGAMKALSKAFAYVSLSRGRHDVDVYTNDYDRMVNILNNSTQKEKALSLEEIQSHIDYITKDGGVSIKPPAEEISIGSGAYSAVGF